MSSSDTSQARRPPRSGGLLERMGLVWSAIYYLTLIIGLLSAVGERPALLRSWEGAAVGLLVALSLTLFQLIYVPFLSFEQSGWPMPARTASFYFGGQLITLTVLFALDRSFLGLGFSLLFQVMGALPRKRWPLPLAGFILLLTWAVGGFDTIGPDSLLNLLGFLFVIGNVVIMGLLITSLFEQRYKLLYLVDELRRAKAAVEAGAAQQEELAVLRERTRLARAMHDSIGHALVLVNVRLEAAQRLYGIDPQRGDAELEAVRELVRGTMGSLRVSLTDLRAPVEPFHDLPTALRRLAAEASAGGELAVTALATDAPPPALAEPLWWIAREALANIERHARAASATIELRREPQGWLLRVDDDGVGIRPAALAQPGHFGLQGMRERAEACGGSVTIGRGPAGGTRVAARLPATVL